MENKFVVLTSNFRLEPVEFDTLTKAKKYVRQEIFDVENCIIYEVVKKFKVKQPKISIKECL